MDSAFDAENAPSGAAVGELRPQRDHLHKERFSLARLFKGDGVNQIDPVVVVFVQLIGDVVVSDLGSRAIVNKTRTVGMAMNFSMFSRSFDAVR